MLLLTRSDVQSVFSMEVAIEAVAQGAREYSAGRATIPPRVPVPVPEVSGTTRFMPGYLPGLGALGAKIVGNFPRNPARGLPTGIGLFVLLDAETSLPLAIMDATYLTDARTGALTGLAARYLARPESRLAGLIGSGGQAKTQLLALAATLPLERVRVWSRQPEHVAAFLAEMAPRLPDLRLEAAASGEAAVRGADVAVTATSANEPVLFGDWLRPDAFVASVGHAAHGRELDESVVARATLIAVDYRAGALTETLDLRGPLEAGLFREEDVVELGELVSGARPGRRAPNELILFKSVGFAAVDLACGQAIYWLARERGLGVEIDLVGSGAAFH